MARKPPFPMWPSHRPSGIAIAQAMAIAAADSLIWGHIRSHMFASPPTWAPPAGDSCSLKMKLIASANEFIGPPPPWSTG